MYPSDVLSPGPSWRRSSLRAESRSATSRGRFSRSRKKSRMTCFLLGSWGHLFLTQDLWRSRPSFGRCGSGRSHGLGGNLAPRCRQFVLIECHVVLVFSKGFGKDVATVIVAHEIEFVTISRVEGGPKRAFSGVRNRPGWQADVAIGIERRIKLRSLSRIIPMG